MFSEDIKDVPCSFPLVLEIRNHLSIPNGESKRALVKFLESICMRAVRDIAITLQEEFVQHWMVWNEELYRGWITWRTYVAFEKTWTYITSGLNFVSFFYPCLYAVWSALLRSSYVVFGVLTSYVFVNTISGGRFLGRGLYP